jgi:hypothetical protein
MVAVAGTAVGENVDARDAAVVALRSWSTTSVARVTAGAIGFGGTESEFLASMCSGGGGGGGGGDDQVIGVAAGATSRNRTDFV